MSKVIVNGKDRRYHVECECCQTIFEYSGGEVKERLGTGLFGLAFTAYEVECPICGSMESHCIDNSTERKADAFELAVKVISKDLAESKDPGSIYHVWQSNIAGTIMDNSDIDHETANKCACRFLDRLIGE